MKRFLITVFVLLGVVLLLVVIAYLYIQTLLLDKEGNSVPEQSVPIITKTAEEETENASTSKTETGGKATPRYDGAEPIALRTIPLSDSQKSLLASAGIDYETFIITPEMISCAKERLGSVRFSEIVSGSAPSGIEMLSLLRCL